MTFMVFKGTECGALECELNKAKAVGKGRRCRWAGVMGYDATLNGLLVSWGGKVERKRFPSVLPPCKLQGRMGPGQQLHHCPPTSARDSCGDLGMCSLLTTQGLVMGTRRQAAGFWRFGDFYITKQASPAHYWLKVHLVKLECPWLGS